MFEEVLKQILQLEGDGFRAEAQRAPATRETDIVVSYRPATTGYVCTSVSENALEDMRSHADYLLSVIGDSAATLRGAAIVEILKTGRQVRFERKLSAEQASGLVSGLLAAIDRAAGLESETGWVLGMRMVEIIRKHADNETRERLAIELMKTVEVVPR